MIATDAALLEQALTGAEDAFTALYRRRQGGVYRFALQMTGSAAIAEDVTQEAFLALLLHGTRYDEARGTGASFLSIEQVRQAVLSLPPVFREVIVLCDLQDSSYEEAAMSLDCPVGTVRSRLNRGRSMLARKLRGVACAGRSIECSPKIS